MDYKRGLQTLIGMLEISFELSLVPAGDGRRLQQGLHDSRGAIPSTQRCFSLSCFLSLTV